MSGKKKIHRTLLLFVLVLTPPFFLLFTEEGRRVSDNVVLWIAGYESVNFNLKEADADFTRDDILKVFGELDWRCAEVISTLGNERCSAEVGSFNDYPARFLSAYFMDKRLNGIQLTYVPGYHHALIRHLIKQLGKPRNADQLQSDTPDDRSVLEWDTGNGVVVIKKNLNEGDQPGLLWLAAENH